MSAICLIVFKEPKSDFDKLNEMAKELVRFAVDNDLAVFFQNSYFPYLFDKDEIRQYFLMSDSFIYQNCDFLSTEGMGYNGMDVFRKEFMKKFDFFNSILSIVFKYGSETIDVYITGGGVSRLEDFEPQQTTCSAFVRDLFESILTHADLYAYGFPPIKFEVSKK